MSGTACGSTWPCCSPRILPTGIPLGLCHARVLIESSRQGPAPRSSPPTSHLLHRFPLDRAMVNRTARLVRGAIPCLYVASPNPARRCHLRAIQVQPSSASPPAVLLWRTCRFNGPYGLTRPVYVFASASSLVRGAHPASFVLTNNTALRVRGADRVQSRAAPRYMRVAVSCSSVAAPPCYCLGCQSGAAPF